MAPESKIEKLRPKLRRRIRKQKDEMNANAELAIPEKPKVIRRYHKQKCRIEGCKLNAVGSTDVCKKHGGDPIIEDNLITQEYMTDMQLHSEYDPAVHPMQYLNLAKQGASEVEIAAEMGVSPRIMRGWGDKYLDFNSAMEIGAALHEAWWLQQGKDNLTNRGYNTSLYKFITGNKLGYSDKVESKNMHVHAGVLQVPAPMSTSDWEEEVKKL